MSRYVIEDDAPSASRYVFEDTPAPKAKAPDVGVMGAIGKGFQHVANNLADGITQMYLSARGEDSALRGLKSLNEQDKQAYAPIQQAHPFATGFGEAIPLMAIPGGQATMGARLMAPTIGAAGLGALQYGSPEERLKAAAREGGAALVGAGAGEVVGRIIKPTSGRMAPNKEVVDAADRQGIPLSAGQRSGVPALQATEDFLAQMPGSRGRMAEFRDTQRAAINKAIAGEIGQNTDNISQGVLADARTSLGATRDALKATARVSPVDPELLSAINKAESIATSGPKSLTLQPARGNIIDDFKEFVMNAPGPMGGPEYQVWRTKLKNAADDAFQHGQSLEGNVYKSLLDGLDKSARRGKEAVWKANDKAFAVLDTLEKPNVVNEATGNVNPKSLAAAFYRQYGSKAKEGGMSGAVNDVALVGKGVPWSEAGSPTMPRLAMLALGGMNLGAVGVPMLTGNIASRVLTNDTAARYLANGLLGSTPAAQAAAEVIARDAARYGSLGLMEGYGNQMATRGLLAVP